MFDRLTSYLSEQNEDTFHVTVRDLEEVLGSTFPIAAREKDWWTWRPSTAEPQQQAIHAGGFIAKLSDNAVYVQFRRHDASRDERGYGRNWRDRKGQLRRRYAATDPATFAFFCVCGKPECPSSRMLPFRDHIAALHELFSRFSGEVAELDAYDWQSVAFGLRMAASIDDVDADTGYVENPMVFALCEATVDYEAAQSEMASKYVAAMAIFNFLWAAYEAAVSVTLPEKLKGLLKDGRLGERGRRLFEDAPELAERFNGLGLAINLADLYCIKGGLFDERITKARQRFPKRDFVFAAELCREFRNFVFHGEDEVPSHPDWGDVNESVSRLRRFYAIGRLLLILIQALAWLSLPSDPQEEHQATDLDWEDHILLFPRHALERAHFRDQRF